MKTNLFILMCLGSVANATTTMNCQTSDESYQRKNISEDQNGSTIHFTDAKLDGCPTTISLRAAGSSDTYRVVYAFDFAEPKNAAHPCAYSRIMHMESSTVFPLTLSCALKESK